MLTYHPTSIVAQRPKIAALEWVIAHYFNEEKIEMDEMERQDGIATTKEKKTVKYRDNLPKRLLLTADIGS